MELSKASIVELLATNDKAVARALVVLNEQQTLDEQRSEQTKHHNARGFRPAHAKMGTSMASFFLRNGYLSPKQIAYWRKPMKDGNMRIGIYWKQLILAAQAKAGRETVTKSIASEDSNEFNAKWAGYKNEFAHREAEQEAAAFRRKGK